jgi:hypothetical protein
MKHPNFADAERATRSEMFAADKESFIRRLVRTIRQAEGYLRDGALLRPVAVHDPEFVAAAAAATEAIAAKAAPPKVQVSLSQPLASRRI